VLGQDQQIQTLKNNEVMVSDKHHGHGGGQEGVYDASQQGAYAGSYKAPYHSSYTVYVENKKKPKKFKKNQQIIHYNTYYQYPKHEYKTYTYPHHTHNEYVVEEKKPQYHAHDAYTSPNDYGCPYCTGYRKHINYQSENLQGYKKPQEYENPQSHPSDGYGKQTGAQHGGGYGKQPEYKAPEHGIYGKLEHPEHAGYNRHNEYQSSVHGSTHDLGSHYFGSRYQRSADNTAEMHMNPIFRSCRSLSSKCDQETAAVSDTEVINNVVRPYRSVDTYPIDFLVEGLDYDYWNAFVPNANDNERRVERSANFGDIPLCHRLTIGIDGTLIVVPADITETETGVRAFRAIEFNKLEDLETEQKLDEAVVRVERSINSSNNQNIVPQLKHTATDAFYGKVNANTALKRPYREAEEDSKEKFLYHTPSCIF
jgi:hypothetical protein